MLNVSVDDISGAVQQRVWRFRSAAKRVAVRWLHYSRVIPSPSRPFPGIGAAGGICWNHFPRGGPSCTEAN